ncbi:hypothetical protein [Solitalea longa]|uniref:hypothetical protein n=1 Tax=Solitalea longa TaxID=2079460 RepID=UPI0013FD3A28|nr:hypothetical protein [Solitalea longa]
MIGFNVNQRKEEGFKAKLILARPDIKNTLFKIEDHPNFKGNVANLLTTPFVDSEKQFTKESLENCQYDDEKANVLVKLFEAYDEISKNDFNPIWGNFLNTGLYRLTYESRLVYDDNFKKHPAILLFAKKYLESKCTLNEFISNIQKEFVNQMSADYDDFGSIRNAKEQLYLYYIIHEQVYQKTFESFFRNYNFNFGWLPKETGYKSHFSEGIEGCKYFPNHNPIFQLYNSQFRYNSGINEGNTLTIEIIGGGKKRDPFIAIQDWANN